jgi:hypothetical protein
MLFKNMAMRIDIENVEIHVRLLVEHRESEDKKKKSQKPEGDANANQNLGSVRPFLRILKAEGKLQDSEAQRLGR